MLEMSDLKASIVLQALVSGLLKSKADSNFTLEMGTYGTVKEGICYGCCATVALAEIFGKGKLASEIMLAYAKTPTDRSDFLYAKLSYSLPLETVQDSLLVSKLHNLEYAIDKARMGGVSLLIHFLTGEANTSFDGRWNLNDHDWEEQLPVVEATIAQMIAAGY